MLYVNMLGFLFVFSFSNYLDTVYPKNCLKYGFVTHYLLKDGSPTIEHYKD